MTPQIMMMMVTMGFAMSSFSDSFRAKKPSMRALMKNVMQVAMSMKVEYEILYFLFLLILELNFISDKKSGIDHINPFNF